MDSKVNKDFRGEKVFPINKIIRIVVAVFLFSFWAGPLSAQTNQSSSPQSSLADPSTLSSPGVAHGLASLPSVAPVVESSKPAVVNIFTVKTVSNRRSGPRGRFPNRNSPREPGPNFPFPPDIFDEFFGFPQAPPQVFRERALGSGFIFDKEGFIITNNHVVEGADEIKVKLDDAQEIAAEVVGRDPKTDLALIKLSKPGDYPFISFGDSDQVRIGDWLVAIGNPFGLEHTVTTGILSARGRAIGAGPYDDFLQTDASINPGNSGGPLLNLNGEVVGINTMIIAGGNGIGFAIPSKLARKIVDQLKSRGHVERGWLGVVIQPLTQDMIKNFGVEDTKGALVSDVVKDTPASRAGIKHGDIIVEFDGRVIKEFGELTSVVADTPVNKVVNVVVIRDKKKLTLRLTVERLVDDSNSSGLEGSNLDLGLTLRELTADLARRLNVQETNGLLVEQVAPNSLADLAGVKARDIILEVDNKPIKSLQEFNAAIRSHSKDQPVLLWLRRGERTLYCPVTLQ
ncbi:MAG: DegQ family serine endoprotease [Deltaproteobacteria bacterium]|jgi:serine protease Do|nr:DegQ family serine endoprotease [Deltaproteobacteria bacterium]